MGALRSSSWDPKYSKREHCNFVNTSLSSFPLTTYTYSLCAKYPLGAFLFSSIFTFAAKLLPNLYIAYILPHSGYIDWTFW